MTKRNKALNDGRPHGPVSCAHLNLMTKATDTFAAVGRWSQFYRNLVLLVLSSPVCKLVVQLL